MSKIRIGGLQKTTLTDFPGKLACTIFTKGCNLRCPYCHNSLLVLEEDKEDDISEEEILRFLRKRKNILDGVCISGGEPLIHKDLFDFIFKIKEMGYSVKLDSNGFFPGRLRQFIGEGLVDYVAMDIKSSPENYWKAAGVNKLDLRKINESIEILKTSQISFEFRTTAVKGIHDTSDFTSIARWLKGPHLYYIQNYKDSADTIASRSKTNKSLKSFKKEELQGFLDLLKNQVPSAQIRYE